MTPNSILIKSITGEIYKITDLAKGIKQPLQPSELAGYNMHPQSGVLMDTDGKLIDLVELLVSGNRVQISEEGRPDNPSTNALYVDKSARSIAVFDEETGEWIELGNGNGDITNILSPDNALSDSDISEVLNIFNTFTTKETK